MPLYAGVCETCITPPIGVWMCGYAFRPSGCTAVHDELFARALVLNNGHEALAILAMDLLGLDFELAGQIRRRIAEETGMAEGAILLNASHTHGGPNTGRLNAMGSRDPAYIDVLVRKLAGAARQAADRLVPASLEYGRASVQLGVNRREVVEGVARIGRCLSGPVMPWVDTLTVVDSRGAPFALLFSHACHPTTLGGENLQITADFPGVACRHIQRESEGAVMPFFLQGCSGNINPSPRGSFEDAARHGLTLGAAALEAMEDSAPLEGDTLGWDEAQAVLPLLPPPPAARCEAAIKDLRRQVKEERARGDQGRLLHAEGLLAYAEHEYAIALQDNPALEFPLPIQMLALGDARVLGFPAEMFVQYALDLDSQTIGPLMSLGCTNGVLGYIPTAADYPFGGYEVDRAHRYYGTLMPAPESERALRQAAYALLEIDSPDWTPLSV